MRPPTCLRPNQLRRSRLAKDFPKIPGCPHNPHNLKRLGISKIRDDESIRLPEPIPPIPHIAPLVPDPGSKRNQFNSFSDFTDYFVGGCDALLGDMLPDFVEVALRPLGQDVLAHFLFRRALLRALSFANTLGPSTNRPARTSASPASSNRSI